MSLAIKSFKIRGQELHSEREWYDFESSSKGKEEKRKRQMAAIAFWERDSARSIMSSHAKSANFLFCWLVLRDTGREQVTAQ